MTPLDIARQRATHDTVHDAARRTRQKQASNGAASCNVVRRAASPAEGTQEAVSGTASCRWYDPESVAQLLERVGRTVADAVAHLNMDHGLDYPPDTQLDDLLTDHRKLIVGWIGSR